MPTIARSTMRTAEVFAFIRARYQIYLRRKQGKPQPWTTDTILQRYRFCNAYREHDTVTKWIAENWRKPCADHPDLWFAMAVARWINWPATLEEIGFPIPWRPKHTMRVLKDRAARGEKVWTGAYTIGTQGTPKEKDKALFVVQRVLDRLWQNRAQLRPSEGDSLAAFARRLERQYAFGGFMTGQVIADIKYVEPLHSADDWWSWAISGPGSRRGLNRVFNRPIDTKWDEFDWLRCLRQLRQELKPLLKEHGMPSMHCQDLQNSGLCEFDKYERVRLGQGKPRSRYPGTSDD